MTELFSVKFQAARVKYLLDLNELTYYTSSFDLRRGNGILEGDNISFVYLTVF